MVFIERSKSPHEIVCMYLRIILSRRIGGFRRFYSEMYVNPQIIVTQESKKGIREIRTFGISDFRRNPSESSPGSIGIGVGQNCV